MRELPPELLVGPFTRERALSLGVTKSMFAGRRLTRVHPRVWCRAGQSLTEAQAIGAARLAIPHGAQLTHLSRLRQLGLDFGAGQPLHFVMAGELHLSIDGIFLHRTLALAPTDEVGITPTGAFIAFCSSARVIDAIQVGDWLVRHGHITLRELTDLALDALWRDGADEALWVTEHLDGRSRSLKESETRAVLAFSGLPKPQVNHPIVLDAMTLVGDLVLLPWGLVVEYDGSHHQEVRAQYTSDIDRYALFRAHRVPYLQVTKERLAQPRILVGAVHRALVDLGYTGPAPQVGEEWRRLFAPIRSLLPDRRTRLRERAAERR